jgi:hypothetical protein
MGGVATLLGRAMTRPPSRPSDLAPETVGNRRYPLGITRCHECGKVIGFCLCAVRAREAAERQK